MNYIVSKHIFGILLSPKDTVKHLCLTHIGLLFANCEVLNRHLVFGWFWSLETIKIMQMETANSAVAMHVGMLFLVQNKPMSLVDMVHARHVV
jgi:hypothetical protein